jgi:nucleolar protein 12
LKQVQTEDVISQLSKPVDEKAIVAAIKEQSGEVEEEKEKGPTRKERKELLSDSQEKQERTLFLGNLPVACATDKTMMKDLKIRFSTYGQVESIRFRSIPFAEPQARRVAFIKKNFRKDGTGGTCNGYVVMKTREAALAALKENANIFAERHLRVDLAVEGEGSTKTNTKKSIFIGNLPMDLEEEPVWQLFGKCGSVTNVRLIRDRVSNMGKGIGYVTFAAKDSVDVALKLNGSLLGGRPVRVSPCAKIGMVEKKKNRAKDLAEKRQKQAAALVKSNPSAPVTLGAAKATTSTSSHAKEIAETEAANNKVSKKEAKLQAELQTKFGQLFHKKFPFAQAISEVEKEKDVKGKVVDAKVTKPKSDNKRDAKSHDRVNIKKSSDKSSKNSSFEKPKFEKTSTSKVSKPTQAATTKPTKPPTQATKPTQTTKPTKIVNPISRAAHVQKPKSDLKSKK